MNAQISQSGRHVTHLLKSVSVEYSDIEKEMEDFWDYVAQHFSEASDITFMRCEVWGDSGRLIAYATGDDGTTRIHENTFQLLLNKLAEEWCDIDEENLSDDQCDRICDEITGRYVSMSRRACHISGVTWKVNYVDADTPREIERAERVRQAKGRRLG